MKNQQNFTECMVGFFIGYKQSPYPELPEILTQLNSSPAISAFAFFDPEKIHPDTTHVVLSHATGYYRAVDSFLSLLSILDKRGIQTINPAKLIR